MIGWFARRWRGNFEFRRNPATWGSFSETVNRDGMQLGDFERRDCAREYAKLVDLAILEPSVAEPLSDGERTIVCSDEGSAFVNTISQDFDGQLGSVEIELQAGGLTRAVVREGNVLPLTFREWLLGADADRVAGPDAIEAGLQNAAGEHQIEAVVADVGSVGLAEHDDW